MEEENYEKNWIRKKWNEDEMEQDHFAGSCGYGGSKYFDRLHCVISTSVI
jgi:hypothetical protein